MFAHLVAHLARNHARLKKPDLMIAAEAIAAIAATEDFQSAKREILGEEDTRSNLVAMDAAFVSSLTTGPEARKKLRPLTDLIREASRGLARK
jgi:hypothetical protein